jgi:hypothetical protein
MKMLRWSGGVTRLDRVRNEHIRGSFGVAPVFEKVKEARLRWYGHVMRHKDHAVHSALNITEQKRGRGRPSATWWRSVEKEMKEAQIDEATTQNRKSWRNIVRRADPK